MRIQFWGHEFDLFDAQLRRLASNQAAVDKMHSIVEKAKTECIYEDHEALTNAFEELLTNLLDWWLASGATLQMAKAKGCEGITIQQALEMHNAIGASIGQQPMELAELQPKAPELIVPDAKG